MSLQGTKTAAKKRAMSLQPEKLLYGREEAAFALGISDRSIDELIANQVVTTRRFGRRVLIPAADVRKVCDLIMRDGLLQGVASVSA